MGIFDSDSKRIIDEAPPQFRFFAECALSYLEGRIAEWRVRDRVLQDFIRTAVLAALAMAAHRELGTWSVKALSDAEKRGDVSLRRLPAKSLGELQDAIDMIWATFRFLLHAEGTQAGEARVDDQKRLRSPSQGG